MSNPLTIVLDAGHGGTEKIGGSSPNNAVGANNLLEKDLTLDIARRTASVLQKDAKVVLTRDDDKNLSLAKRAAIAGINKAAVFLSIHFNGFQDKNVDGTETFVTTKANPSSEKLARNVLDSLVNVTQVANRGVKRADLGVLLPGRHLPQTAACLAEIAFLTNPKQAKQLADAAYRQQIAVALGEAILKSLPANAPTVAPQSFSFDDAENLDARYFQPLDAGALGGNPIFDIKESVGKGGANKEDDVHAVKKRLIALGFDWITLDKKIDNLTIDAIRLFQTIIAGHNSISGDGKISVGKNTHLWLQAVNAPRWQTMPAGSAAEGFFNFELTDTRDTHDFGTDWMAEAIKSAGAHYRDNYLKTNAGAALLTVNDVSLEKGGNTPDHGGHEAGLSGDLQLPRTDGRAGLITHADALFDRSAARAILNALRAQPLVSKIFFNDRTLIREGLCNRLADHDDHIHFEVKPPARGAIETDGMGNYHSGGRLYQGSRLDDIDYQTHALENACANSIGVKADKAYVLFNEMAAYTKKNHGKNDSNVYLVWNDIPKGACEIDVVVHFHGYNKPDEKTIGRVASLSGLDLSRRQPPTLCILPLGSSEPEYVSNGEKKTNSDRHIFPFFTAQADGLQKLIDASLNLFAERNNLPKGSFTRKRLILTAHSGGGAAVAGVLSLNKYPVDEVHLFDAVYGGQDKIFAWADKKIKSDSAARGALRVLCLPLFYNEAKNCVNSGTKAPSLSLDTNLKKLMASYPQLSSRYRVELTGIKHNSIPITFGAQLLADAAGGLDDSLVPSAYINPCCVNTPENCGVKREVKQQSSSFDYGEEADYFAENEANYVNY